MQPEIPVGMEEVEEVEAKGKVTGLFIHKFSFHYVLWKCVVNRVIKLRKGEMVC